MEGASKGLYRYNNIFVDLFNLRGSCIITYQSALLLLLLYSGRCLIPKIGQHLGECVGLDSRISLQLIFFNKYYVPICEIRRNNSVQVQLTQTSCSLKGSQAPPCVRFIIYIYTHTHTHTHRGG